MRRLSVALAAFLLAAPVVAPTAWAGDANAAQLMKIDRTVGTGTVARDGDVVRVDYTGWLYDAGAKDHHGKQFDSSYDNGQPISFTLGAGQVIEGWDQGIRGMHVGGRRTLVIPARLAYGDRGAGGDIPPGATLVFDVVLVGVN